MRHPLNLALSACAIAGPAVGAPLPPVVHSWAAGAVVGVTTAPGRVSDLVLEPGETLAGEGPIAAGDTARWIIGQSESGTGATRQVHVLVKPIAPGLATNLIVNTNRRSYLVDLRSTADTWAPLVSWRYPAGQLIAVAGRPEPVAAAPPPPAPDLDYGRLDFGWRIEGNAPFRPLRVFDDGARLYIDLPPAVASGSLPLLFVAPGAGEPSAPATIRLRGSRMILDRKVDAAELRLGAGRSARRVRLVRAPAS